MRLKYIAAAAVAGAIFLLNGCVAVSQNETPEQFMNSSIITSSVKARLANTAGLETLSLSVQTLNGDVLLSGFAQNEEQKKMAEYVAQTTEGVRKVINHIVVQ
jgi:osmotically-inducible protein OsmY